MLRACRALFAPSRMLTTRGPGRAGVDPVQCIKSELSRLRDAGAWQLGDQEATGRSHFRMHALQNLGPPQGGRPRYLFCSSQVSQSPSLYPRVRAWMSGLSGAGHARAHGHSRMCTCMLARTTTPRTRGAPLVCRNDEHGAPAARRLEMEPPPLRSASGSVWSEPKRPALCSSAKGLRSWQTVATSCS